MSTPGEVLPLAALRRRAVSPVIAILVPEGIASIVVSRSVPARRARDGKVVDVHDGVSVIFRRDFSLALHPLVSRGACRNQVNRYGRFVADPTPEELEYFFFLDEVRGRRRAHNKLGWAVQWGTVRMLGTFLTVIPGWWTCRRWCSGTPRAARDR
jgi:hypothetical protein